MASELVGRVLNDSSIAVDYFDKDIKNGIYFLTEGNLKVPLPPHVDRVYTSPYNARLLQTKFQISPNVTVGLDMNKKLLIQDDTKKLDFHVTLMEAQQKPGAVMFLFEGASFGNILYAGKCCYNDYLFSRSLCSFLKTKVLDFLYIHDACEDCHIHSKSVSLALEDICTIARLNPHHKVFIVEPCLREDILKCLKEKLKSTISPESTISVSGNMMQHLKDIGEGQDFTLSYKGVQVLVTDNPREKWRIHNVPVQKIILIPCSPIVSSKNAQAKLKKLKKRGYHVIYYRNHCSKPELVSLVRDINAKHTVLIRPLHHEPHVCTKEMDVDYWSRLGCLDKLFDFLEAYKSIGEQTESEVCEEVDNFIENKSEICAFLENSDFSDEYKLEDPIPSKDEQNNTVKIWLGSDGESTEM